MLEPPRGLGTMHAAACCLDWQGLGGDDVPVNGPLVDQRLRALLNGERRRANNVGWLRIPNLSRLRDSADAA
eukprot:1533946-Pyramimonas_sp.AAC.1